MSTRNPNDNPLEARLKAVEQQLQANPLRATSVERGVTEFYNQSTLLITDSNLRVVGIAYVSGRLEGEGTFSWSGPALLDGSVEITNTLDVLAQTRLRGDTTIESLTKLLAELQVEGKITAGNVTVEEDKITVGGGASPATLQDGALGFGTGGKVEADPTNSGVRMTVGANRVYVGTGAVALQVGSRSVTVTPSGVTFGGLPTIAQSELPESMPVGSAYIDPSGLMYRVVAG